ncbi:hypothetical protein H0H92_000620 [Tricholoma furcatifolium]|nr:hypothetical protein H0H92_000620 [Tricholoma furcatifolium]
MGCKGKRDDTPRGPNDDDGDDDDLVDLMQRAASISKAPAPARSRSGPGGASGHSEAEFDGDECFEVDVKPFIDAAEDYLRSGHPGRTKPAAYVVYHGRIPGEAQAAWNLALRQRTVGPPGSSAAHLSSMQPPSTPRTPRTPASAARLAAIREGLAQQSPTPQPRRRKSTSPAAPAKLVRGPVASPTPPIEPRCASPSHVAPPTAATSPLEPRCPALDPASTPPTSPRVWSYLPEDTRYTQPVPEVVNGVPFLSDENAWYAVLEGRRPGVYHGRTAAARALGRSPGFVRMAATEDEANRIFVRAFMSRNV